MKKKLITFGDSWPLGTELQSHERPFGYILANMLEVDAYENLAIGGASPDSLVYTLNKYIKSCQDESSTIAVFFISALSRAMFLDYQGQPKMHKVPQTLDHFSKDPVHIYFKYFHSYYHDMFNAQRTLVTLQSMCRSIGIKDFYLSGFTPIDLDFSGINPDLVYPKTCLELFGLEQEEELSNNQSNPYICTGGCHPNQQGHEFIAKTFYDWINNVQSTI